MSKGGRRTEDEGRRGTRAALVLCPLSFVLLFAACASDGGTIEAPGPQPGVDVQRYAVDLDLDPEALAVSGRAALDVAHPAELATLALGLDRALDVAAVRVDGEPAPPARDGDALSVPLAASGADGRSRIEVVYAGRPTEGLYADTFEGDRVVYTDGWPDRGAGWLPGVHAPSDPAALDLTVRVPELWRVVPSGTVAAESVEAGRRVVQATLAADAPTYTFGFVAGPFELVEDGAHDGAPVRHALLPASRAEVGRLGRTVRALAVLDSLLGPYPYRSFTTVQVPFGFAGMEVAAAPFLRADLYAADVPGRNAIEEVVIHEAVHQWFGNAVVPADWADLWLAEGPATYLTAVAYGALDGAGAERRHLARVVAELEPRDARRRLVPRALADPADALSPTPYHKGAVVMHLLRLRLGDAFWPAMRELQTAFADAPLSTAAFQGHLERAAGAPLDDLFDAWVWGTELPRLRTRWDRDTGTLAWEVENDAVGLAELPVELVLIQGETEAVARLADGVASLPPGDAPDVYPVGVYFER